MPERLVLFLGSLGWGKVGGMTHGLNVLLGLVVLVLGVLAIVEWNIAYGAVLTLIGVVQSGLGSRIYRS